MLCNYYLILCYISCQHHIKTHRRRQKAIVNPYANKHHYANKKKERMHGHILSIVVFMVLLITLITCSTTQSSDGSSHPQMQERAGSRC